MSRTEEPPPIWVSAELGKNAERSVSETGIQFTSWTETAILRQAFHRSDFESEASLQIERRGRGRDVLLQNHASPAPFRRIGQSPPRRGGRGGAGHRARAVHHDAASRHRGPCAAR